MGPTAAKNDTLGMLRLLLLTIIAACLSEGALVPKRAVGTGVPLRSSIMSPEQAAVSLKAPANYAEAQLELQRLKERMERMEQQWSAAVSEAALLSGDAAEGAGTGDEAGIAATLMASPAGLSARTLEICTATAFFVIGFTMGASLFDRLGLIGGLSAAYWSSGAIKRDTRSGALARNIGRRVAHVVIFLRLKWEELVVFYKTGKLAFLGKAQYEKLDTRFGIEQRIAEFKRLSMVRIAELGQKEVAGRDKLNDFMRVVSRSVRDPDFRAGVQSRGVSLWQQVAKTVPKVQVKILVEPPKAENVAKPPTKSSNTKKWPWET